MSSSNEGVAHVIAEVLEELLPDMELDGIAKAAALIADGTAALPLTTRVTLRERVLTWRVAQLLHSNQQEPGPSVAGPPVSA